MSHACWDKAGQLYVVWDYTLEISGLDSTSFHVEQALTTVKPEYIVFHLSLMISHIFAMVFVFTSAKN